MSIGFQGDWSKVLWSKSSPQEGDPDCLCSYCGAWIPEATVCIRMWHKKDGATLEARFCNPCADTYLGIKTVE